MKTIDYDEKEAYSGNTETHEAVDTHMRPDYKDQNRMHEGFSASHGVRPGTAESGGRDRSPEVRDRSHPDATPDSIQEENPGLAGS